jgi:hypothetical protein
VTAAILIYGGAETGRTRTASGAAGDPGLYSLCLEALCASVPGAGGAGCEGPDGEGEGKDLGGDDGISLYMSFCEVVNEVRASLQL